MIDLALGLFESIGEMKVRTRVNASQDQKLAKKDEDVSIFLLILATKYVAGVVFLLRHTKYCWNTSIGVVFEEVRVLHDDNCEKKKIKVKYTLTPLVADPNSLLITL